MKERGFTIMFYNFLEIVNLIFRLLKEYWHFILFIWVCVYTVHLTKSIEQNINIKNLNKNQEIKNDNRYK